VRILLSQPSSRQRSSREIVSAAIAGELPRGLGLSDMTDLPMNWVEQKKALEAA